MDAAGSMDKNTIDAREKMKRVCEQIAAYNPYISAEIHEFIGLGVKRAAFVANLNEEAVREAESLQASFAIPQAM